MKKILSVMCITLLTLLATAAIASPPDSAESSGEQTADAVILASEGLFYGIIIMPDGTNQVTVSFYDNASAASGTEFLPTMRFAGDGGAQAFAPPYPIPCHNGIYIDVTVAGAGTVDYVILRKAGR